jgi:hypothetical protein
MMLYNDSTITEGLVPRFFFAKNMTRKAGIYIDGRNFEIGALSTLGYDVTTDFSEMHHFDFVSFFRDIA